MKKQKLNFNDMLRRYNRYLRKLSRLEITGRNEHRQGVLTRHIERLKEKLHGLYLGIKGVAALAAISGMCMLAAPEVHAQQIEPAFADSVSNPFGLIQTEYMQIPEFSDLDGDGDLDMLTAEFGIFYYFQNTGTAIAPAFADTIRNPFGLPSDLSYHSLLTFADLDGDGDIDMMAGQNSAGLYYFQNTGTSIAPAFEDSVRNPFGLIKAGVGMQPSFVDLDGDGDMDIMAGVYNGDLFYFQNTGTSIAPAFADTVSNPFGLLNFGKNSFVDLDQDGDIDILTGKEDGNFIYFENTGSSIAPAFADSVSNPFDLSGVQSNAAPVFADLDTDGDIDMLSGDFINGFYYFENTGQRIAHEFDTVATNPFGLASVMHSQSPTLVDLDSDGDLDIIKGSGYGDFYFFENTGTSIAPAFADSVSNPFGLASVGYNSSPTFSDLDGDGDMDMLTGEQYSNFYYFQNTGTSIAPAFAGLVSNPFGLASLGDYQSSPTFVDLDGDGDMDLLSGSYSSGIFYYFENTGTNIAPAFAGSVPNPFGLSAMGLEVYSSTPAFADLDGDGDMDLLSGRSNEGFYYYENTGTSTAPAFASKTLNPFELFDIGTYSSVTFGDLNGDGKMDMLSGQGDKFYYFENIISPPDIIWDGDTDSDWATASNWGGDVLPTSGDDITIPDVASNDPVITSDITVDDIEIESGGKLTITSNSLKTNGIITLDGTLVVASGASLIPLDTIIGAGKAIVHRNTTFGVTDGKYSAIGSPVTLGTTDSLGSIVYKYDETIAYDSLGTQGGARFIAVASPEVMAVGDAYFSANTGAISFEGIPNNGELNLAAFTVNSAQDGTFAGFNLISNPYPASISYTKFMEENSNNGTLYFWDDGGSDVGARTNSDYVTATGMGAAGAGSGRAAAWDGHIRSAQGFFVKTSNDDPLRFRPSMMGISNNSDGGFFREEKPTALRFSISSADAYNDILIGFKEDATLGFDRMLDAYKLKGNKNLQFYSKMGDDIMAIQALPELTDEMTIDLGFDVADAGTYTFELKDGAQYGFGVYLKDHKLGKLIDLSEQNAYTFESAAVQNSNRFTLVFAPSAVLAIDDKLVSTEMIVFSNPSGVHIRMNNNLKNASVSIYNLSGTLVKHIDKVDFTGADWTTSFNEQGLFIITVQAEGQLFVKKFVK